MDDKELMRINKYLAAAGICSRREADVIVGEGRVTINGETAVSGSKVAKGDTVICDGEEILLSDERTVVAFYKPAGVTCTAKDEHADLIIDDVFKYPKKLTYAGRLDKDSEGLLIMTDDGDLIDGMMRAKNHHEKEYIVTVKQEVTADFLKKMSAGVFIPELGVKTRRCKVRLIGGKKFGIILTQGLNRQIRRMCATLGYDVEKIFRVRIMNITVDGLKPGEYREIGEQEKQELYRGVFEEDGR